MILEEFFSFICNFEWKYPVTVCLKRCLYRIQAYRSWNIAFCPNGFGKLTFTQKLFQCEVHVPRKAFISHVNNKVWTFLRTSLVDIFCPVKYCFVVVVVNVMENLSSLGALIPKFRSCLIFHKNTSQGWKYKNKSLLLRDISKKLMKN